MNASYSSGLMATVPAGCGNGGGIILLHDARDSHARMEGELANDPYGVFNRSWLPEAVEKIIVALRQRGYTIGSPGDYFIRKDS